MRRVVVTGLGMVSPLGLDVESSWKALLAGECGIGPITEFDASEFGCRIAGEVKNFDPAAGGLQAKEARRYDRYVQFAAAAATEALKDAGTDECSIVAVLYEVENEEDETLDGSNVLNDSRIVASAIMTSGEQKDFKQFGLELNYTGEYNPANKYKFAIVCSSSKNGSGYKGPEGTVLGARGSMLIVDEISVYSAF